MHVLAIDASLRNTGVAIVDANNGKPRPLYFGTIHNTSAMRPSSCLVAIRDRLVELIRAHEPDCCALESVIYVQSYKTAIVLGAARGAAILAAAENGLPVFEYSPRRIKQSSLSARGSRRRRDGELGGAHLPHPLFAINRGGQATYHGPGQLMGYPIIDLRRCGHDLHKYLRWLEQLLIEVLAKYGIAASRCESLTGVWIENRKIVSIGIGVRNWITMHGFALNVCGELSPFDHI